MYIVCYTRHDVAMPQQILMYDNLDEAARHILYWATCGWICNLVKYAVNTHKWSVSEYSAETYLV